MEYQPVESQKPKQVSRTFSMVKGMASQRGTLGFLLILFGVILLAGVFCFSSFDSDDEDIRELVKERAGTKDLDRKSNIHRIAETKSKISLKKQIFVGIQVQRSHSNQIANTIRSWVPEFNQSEHSGGVHFVSDVPLSTDLIDSLIVQTAYIRSDEERATYKLLKSIDYYTNTSRAFWYLSIPLNTYINTAAIKHFTEGLSTYDPIKDELFFKLCPEKTQCIYLFSRAATKAILEYNKDMKTLSKFIDQKATNPIRGFYTSAFSPDTQKLLDDSSFEGIKKCNGQETNVLPIKEVFGFIYDIDSDPLQVFKLKMVKDAKDDYQLGLNNNSSVFCSK